MGRQAFIPQAQDHRLIADSFFFHVDSLARFARPTERGSSGDHG